ncbi:MAG: peptide-N-glycosidase [Candidatus Delongbacteria bacterium]|nr:peptide-N-glycosidase [Candidatus Delongbacteria bacterium]
MKLFINIFLTLTLTLSASAYKVTYEQYSKDKKQGDDFSFTYSSGIAYLSGTEDKIRYYTDFKAEENVSTIKYEEILYKDVTPFDSLPKPEFSDKSETILDYECQYASYIYFSNKIEVWFTEKTEAKGSPYSRFLPKHDALALKIVINGDRKIIAKSIEKLDEYTEQKYNAKEAKLVTKPEFDELKINSRFIKVKVFEEETVNFDPEIKPAQDEVLKNDTTYHFSKGSVVMKKIKLTDEMKKNTMVFAKLRCRSNGDAYDRTGSAFIIPVNDKISVLDAYKFGLDTLPVSEDNKDRKYQGIARTDNYDPVIEIIRFITSFGADHFNEKNEINNYDWEDDVIYKQEISSLIPNDKDEMWVGVFVGNYDKGGHKVSLDLDFHPGYSENDSIKVKKYIQPLFSTVNTLEMSGQNYGKLFDNDTLRVEFEISEKIEDIKLLYTTTGHGGWGGGDEFNPKQNQVFIDGVKVFKIFPWRTDCGTYRMYNPASGNFGNGVSSSDLSRSNWCPAMLTPPYIIPLDTLKQGKHTMEIVIDQGKEDGNAWNVTGVLTGQIETKIDPDKKEPAK